MFAGWKNTVLGSVLAACFSLHAVVAYSSENWAAQLAGLDSVVVSCIDHSDGNYGDKLCAKYVQGVANRLKADGVNVVDLGYFRHDETVADRPNELKAPLNLVLFIRGTAGGQVAIQLRARASVTYLAAVEKGAEGAGRAGELVVWEKSTTGSGPAKQLQPAIVEAMSTRTKDLLKQLATHLGK